MQDKVLYFGYGANRDPLMMETITKSKGLSGVPAVLKDWELCIQGIDKVPDIVAPNSPAPVSPRHILKGSWPNEGRDFASYTIRPAKGKEVRGTLWTLSDEERALVKNWELIDFGWYQDATVPVEVDGQIVEVETEVLGDGQELNKVVDGKEYPIFLNEVEDFRRSTEESYNAYFRAMPEGSISAAESKS